MKQQTAPGRRQSKNQHTSKSPMRPHGYEELDNTGKGLPKRGSANNLLQKQKEASAVLSNQQLAPFFQATDQPIAEPVLNRASCQTNQCHFIDYVLSKDALADPDLEWVAMLLQDLKRVEDSIY